MKEFDDGLPARKFDNVRRQRHLSVCSSLSLCLLHHCILGVFHPHPLLLRSQTRPQFQFVNFTEVASKSNNLEVDFAVRALMEIPEQYLTSASNACLRP